MSQQYPCQHCGASYSSEADLDAHLELVHRCPKCGLLLSDGNAVEAHLAQVHGLRHFGAVEPELAELVEIPDWVPPKIPIPTDQGELYKWLFPICELIARASKPKLALENAPPELGDRVEYVKHHFERVVDMVKLKRYKRLKDPVRKSAYLVIALAHLDISPSYALQQFRPPDSA